MDLSDLSTLIQQLSTKKVPDASNMCFGIVVSENKADISGNLLRGCVLTLEEHGALPENIHIKTVPSAFQLVYGANQMTLTGNYDAVILLGCIIRGETSQFDLLGHGIYDGISHLMTFKETPIVCGVLTTETMEQAIARSQHGPLNIGAESAVEAIKMAKF
jgi:6,7-dimethyl-8-ribityllumazine synthase